MPSERELVLFDLLLRVLLHILYRLPQMLFMSFQSFGEVVFGLVVEFVGFFKHHEGVFQAGEKSFKEFCGKSGYGSLIEFGKAHNGIMYFGGDV